MTSSYWQILNTSIWHPWSPLYHVSSELRSPQCTILSSHDFVHLFLGNQSLQQVVCPQGYPHFLMFVVELDDCVLNLISPSQLISLSFLKPMVEFDELCNSMLLNLEIID